MQEQHEKMISEAPAPIQSLLRQSIQFDLHLYISDLLHVFYRHQLENPSPSAEHAALKEPERFTGRG